MKMGFRYFGPMPYMVYGQTEALQEDRLQTNPACLCRNSCVRLVSEQCCGASKV